MSESQSAQHQSFLPDLCGLPALFAILILGQLLAFILTLSAVGARLQALDTLALVSLYVQIVALSSAAVLCLTRRWLGRLPDVHAALLSYFMVMVTVYVVTEAAWWVLNPLDPAGAVITLSKWDFELRTLLITAIFAALVLRYFYVQHHWQRQTLSEARARLEALQARIRPHFLFNCMNTIASLTRTRPAVAEQVVEDLADLFRATLQDAHQLSTLSEELELARRYLAIEQLRLGERLRVDWDVASLPGDVPIPALTLQPLVENAVYHGIEPLPGGGTIRVAGAMEGDHVRLVIANPVAGGRGSRHQGNRLAQENVRLRLAAHFAERGALRVREDAGQYVVELRVPGEDADVAHRDRR